MNRRRPTVALIAALALSAGFSNAGNPIAAVSFGYGRQAEPATTSIEQEQFPGFPPLSKQAAYWWARALGNKARNPAKAILVSRVGFRRLRSFRSWQDMGALRDYVEWADRAEAVGFRQNVVIADVGIYDLILLRVPAASVKAPVPVYRDPIGYAVLQPPRIGRVRIPVTLSASPAPVPAFRTDLPVNPIPLISAAVRDGELVSIFGEALSGRVIKVFSRRGAGEVLYASPTQVNVRVPSIDEVSIEVDGLRSDWSEVRR